jgi:LuxR family maltose regulon positive regulatory protein
VSPRGSTPPPTLLLDTKFFVPRSPRGLVPRVRLAERMQAGAASRLMLVSAPAGFGKTTLLADALLTEATGAGQPSIAWLSLDHRDNDASLFWRYVVAALRTVVPGVGDGALALLQGRDPAPFESMLTSLLNDVHALGRDVVLVLDDYHVIDDGEVERGVAFLLDHLPPQLHLVIASRADPKLPLARLRARGELVEVRAADLRFTAEEAAAYLNDAMGLALTAEDVTALERRTEGWIAALQLAALSMQGRDDVGGFIAGFAGDDRYIVDYLVEEVLDRQPDHIRNFLVQTSILDRLSGPLCDMVTGRGDGRRMLETLERANLFLIPLDDNRRWYRYHHLFADVLKTHLLDEQPDMAAALHRRASDWYGRNGEYSPAVRHALAGDDVEQAADLVELAIPALRRDRQEATIRGWLDAIPDEIVRIRPVLGIGFIGALMARNEFEGVEQRLQDVERCLTRIAEGDTSGAPPRIVVVDKDELPRLPGAIELYRAGLALVSGDVPATITHARLATDRAMEDDHVVRAGAAALAGLAFWTIGDLDAAHHGYTVCVEGLQRGGHISDVLGCCITLAEIRTTQGRLDDAERTYRAALRLASDESVPAHATSVVMRGTADMYVGLSRIAYERNDLEAVTRHLTRARELGDPAGLPQNPYRSRVAEARLREAEGDLPGAVALLEEAERVFTSDFLPNVRPVAASRARVLAALGRTAEALTWAADQHLTAADRPTYLREYEHITLARVLLAQHRAEPRAADMADLMELLDRLLSAAEAGGRTGSVIEILVLQALSHQAVAERADATATLERALTLAEPQGYVRVFVGEGVPMASLLSEVARRRPAWEYVHHLLAPGRPRPDGPDRQSPSVRAALVEPLSARELDVLRLLGTDLDGPDIARELSVSLNTLRTHTKNIYAKLGVNSRRAAVGHAARLGLSSGSRDR